METNKLYTDGITLVRVLKLMGNEVLVIDCKKLTMPMLKDIRQFEGYRLVQDDDNIRNDIDFEITAQNPKLIRIMHEKFTVIANILPFIENERERSRQINISSELHKVSKQTVRKYLCRYLAYNDIRCFASDSRKCNKELTEDEKNMRWSLNKYFYNYRKNTLKVAYKMMLKEKYCDDCGMLLPSYPTFNQYRYFYRKHKKLQNYYITRNGLTNYQRNDRPCLGDGVRELANNVGVGMVDSTVCDIYLVNSSGELVGRPILTALIDAYSGLCCGYSLLFENGIYSIRKMMINVVEDKVEHCKKFGIVIEESEWPSKVLPGVIMTDQGLEYVSETFEQITELGIKIVNLDPYRPELKGPIEKLFDLIQNGYKPYLKGKGVIEPDFQERGAHDYRKDACLTLEEFEKIIIKCILHHNAHNIVKFPFSDEMIEAGTKPYSNDLWNWGIRQIGANVIVASKKQVSLTLLPRTIGKFDRFGLHVNKMRYRKDGYTEKYLAGGNVTAAYNPDDISYIWLVDDGEYQRFELIERRFAGKSLQDVDVLREKQEALVKNELENELQAEIRLANDISVIAANCTPSKNVEIANVKGNRLREQKKYHLEYLDGGKYDE